MTRSELLHSLRTMTSGTIAVTIGSDKYADIERSVSNAILYASQEATEAEITAVDDLSDLLSFLTVHKDYNPLRIQLTARCESNTILQKTGGTIMTIRELAAHIIEHADKKQTVIDLDQAQHIIDLLDRSEQLLESLTAQTFMDAWNAVINAQKSEEGQSIMKYEVNYTDPATGTASPIDTITAPAGYTAEDYIRDCDKNADPEFCKMLHAGSVTLTQIDD